MSDGSETRYTPQIRAEIERRWQDAPSWGYDRSSFGIYFEGTPPGSCPGDQRWRFWLETMGHAQDDIQILLEGLATAERSLLAATARIAEVEEARREDCDRYTAMVRRVGEANLELRAIIEEERKDRDDG